MSGNPEHVFNVDDLGEQWDECVHVLREEELREMLFNEFRGQIQSLLPNAYGCVFQACGSGCGSSCCYFEGYDEHMLAEHEGLSVSSMSTDSTMSEESGQESEVTGETSIEDLPELDAGTKSQKPPLKKCRRKSIPMQSICSCPRRRESGGSLNTWSTEGFQSPDCKYIDCDTWVLEGSPSLSGYSDSAESENKSTDVRCRNEAVNEAVELYDDRLELSELSEDYSDSSETRHHSLHKTKEQHNFFECCCTERTEGRYEVQSSGSSEEGSEPMSDMRALYNESAMGGHDLELRGNSEEESKPTCSAKVLYNEIATGGHDIELSGSSEGGGETVSNENIRGCKMTESSCKLVPHQRYSHVVHPKRSGMVDAPRFWLPPKPTTFKALYKKRAIPALMQVGNQGNKKNLVWRDDVDKLDYACHLPVFFEGLRLFKDPYHFCARQGILDMLQHVTSHELKEILPTLVDPIKDALDTHNRDVVCSTVTIIRALMSVGPDQSEVAEALIPHFSDILPTFSLFFDDTYISEYDRDGRNTESKTLGSLIKETLVLFQQLGPSGTFIEIVSRVPQCKPYMNTTDTL